MAQGQSSVRTPAKKEVYSETLAFHFVDLLAVVHMLFIE